MMTVEEKPDVTYNDVGGCKEQIEKMREVRECYLTCIFFFWYIFAHSAFEQCSIFIVVFL